MIKGKQELRRAFIGRWRIVKMSEWDNDFVDEDVKAYLLIEKSGSGEFRFGYVSGDDVHGEFKQQGKDIIFDFTWDGSDECDHVFGDGWMKLTNKTTAEGELRFHGGEKSHFWVKKLNERRKEGTYNKKQRGTRKR